MRPSLFLLFLFFLTLPALADPFVRFEVKGKVGLKDEMGKVLIPPSFEALGWSDGNFSVIGQVTGYKMKGRWGIINLQKELITQADFESLTYPGGERVIVSRKINPFTVKFGCLDLAGKVTIPFQYDGIAIKGLRAIVFIKNGSTFEYGLVDLNDKGFIPMHYRHIHPIGTLRYGVENIQRKTALYSEDGVQLTDFEIDSISEFRHGLAVIYQNFAQGLIDREGEVKAKPLYRDIRIENGGVVWTRDFDEWKILDAQNHEHHRIRADQLKGLANGFYQVRIAGKTGLLDREWKTVLPLTYDFVGEDDNGHRVVGLAHRYGIIRKDLSAILPPEFDSIALDRNYVRALKRVQGRSTWLLYDTFGIQKTVSAFDLIAPYNGHYFPVKKRGYWGAVNRYGEEFVKCVFDSLLEHDTDQLVVKFRGQFGIIDKTEKWLLPPQRYPVFLMNEDLYFERRDSITFLKNFKGDVIYFTMHPISPEGDGLKESLADGTVRYLDAQGLEIRRTAEPVSSDGIQTVFPASEGLRAIKKDGKFGFVDARGRLRIANRYDDVSDFHEGLAPVKLIGKWGYINTRDQIAINPNYETVGPFFNGNAIVWRNGKAGLIDKEGKMALAFRYDTLVRLTDQTFLTRASSLYGLVDQKGNVLIESRFDVLQNLGNGYVIVGREGKMGLVTFQGFSVVPMIYDALLPGQENNQYLAMIRSRWKELKFE